MGTSPPHPAEQRRSKRVVLRIAIVVTTHTPDGEPMREETRTSVVNAHGGLLQLKMEVFPGQPLLLLNPKTKAKQPCRVVRVDHPPGEFTAVAFEFDRPAPGFWPITFPPSNWTVPSS